MDFETIHAWFSFDAATHGGVSIYRTPGGAMIGVTRVGLQGDGPADECYVGEVIPAECGGVHLAAHVGGVSVCVGGSQTADSTGHRLAGLSDECEANVELEMEKFKATMAEQVAQAARDFQERQTGHLPKAVTVLLSNDTLVITLHEALTPAERALAKTTAGAAKVQEFHRQLFAESAQTLLKEITRITGVEVREAIAQVETTTGAVVQVFSSGTMVQVFQLAQGITEKTWNAVTTAEGS